MPIEPCAETPSVSADDRVALFRLVLLQRIFEDREMALYRQGRIPGSVYTGRGQEAVAAAAGYALGPDDVVAPLNRELACHFARGVTTADVFRNFLGRANGPTFGRDGNLHFGAPGQSATGTVDPKASSTSIRLGTDVGVDIPGAAVSGKLDVTVKHLAPTDIPPLDPGLVNVTAPDAHGFEFRPHGQKTASFEIVQ